MGDAINCGLTIYACPPAEARHFLEVIEEWQLVGAATTRGGSSIKLGSEYLDEGRTYTGAAFDIAARLDSTAPGSTWEVWQGVTYDREPGRIFRYAPGLGTWSGNCDQAGHPAVTSVEIRWAFAEYDTDEARLRAIGKLIGQQWADAFAALPAGARVAPPKVYDVTWDRRDGAFSVEDPDDGATAAIFENGPRGLTRDAQDLELLRVDADAFLAAHGWTLSGKWTGVASGRIQVAEAFRTDAGAAPVAVPAAPAVAPAGGAA